MSREESLSEPFISGEAHHHGRSGSEPIIFEELPKASIVSVSRPDASDISPLLLSYTIEFQYKQAIKIGSLFCFFLYSNERCDLFFFWEFELGGWKVENYLIQRVVDIGCGFK